MTGIRGFWEVVTGVRSFQESWEKYGKSSKIESRGSGGSGGGGTTGADVQTGPGARLGRQLGGRLPELDESEVGSDDGRPRIFDFLILSHICSYFL